MVEGRKNVLEKGKMQRKAIAIKEKEEEILLSRGGERKDNPQSRKKQDVLTILKQYNRTWI